MVPSANTWRQRVDLWAGGLGQGVEDDWYNDMRFLPESGNVLEL